MNLNSVLSTALLASVVGAGASPAAAACLELTKLALPHTMITAAESIAAGTYTAPDGEVFTDMPAFCRIAATLTPTSDSNIKIEVWMPFSGWNRKFLGTGNGGIGGKIVYSSLARGVLSNYAVTNTDMGTSPAATDPLGGRVLTGHPEKQIDFATRSTHLMTARAKKIIGAFYGESPRYSYFFGCSVGGAQGVHEALQFPGDYDGIYAGAPAMNSTHNAAGFMWNYGAFNRNPVQITAAQVSAVTAAIIKQCAGKDGGQSSDKFLTDPRDCHWDPAALQCTQTAADASTCLSAPQVAAMRKFYQGPVNPRTGKRILAGRLLGSEGNGAGGPVATEALPRPDTSSPYWVFGNDFDYRTFDFDHDMDAFDEEKAEILNANTADLEKFRLHGGKLILWHGFADPQVPTLNTIAYYERLIAGRMRDHEQDKGERAGPLRRTQEFARLFLDPGVGHCGGGAGPDTFNALLPLQTWVEDGVAPDQIIASKMTGSTTLFARPLCPYPGLPAYKGTGDSTDAGNFVCIPDRGDNNQPPAPKYLDDRDNYPIVPSAVDHRRARDSFDGTR